MKTEERREKKGPGSFQPQLLEIEYRPAWLAFQRKRKSLAEDEVVMRLASVRKPCSWESGKYHLENFALEKSASLLNPRRDSSIS